MGQWNGSYLKMLYERLVLVRELLAPDGWLFLHLGPNVVSATPAAATAIPTDSGGRRSIKGER